MGNRIAYLTWSNLDFRFSRVGTGCERILGQPGHDLSSGRHESGSRWGAVCPNHMLERQARKCRWPTEVQQEMGPVGAAVGLGASRGDRARGTESHHGCRQR